MLFRTDEVLTICRRVDAAELTLWVERHWVRPRHEGSGYAFSDADVARLELICDLRRDLALDDEALPVVLSLLDSVYGLRRRLRALGTAIGRLPPDVRDRLSEELRMLDESAEV